VLTKMEVYSPQASATELPLLGSGPSTDPIQIRQITGLGPVKASVNTSPYGSIDGESYIGSSVGKRNIVLTLGLNPDWINQSMSSLREQLYAYFMSKQMVTLRFFSDTIPTCEIIGYVESFEPNIFSKDPEIQISIICPMPDFIAVDIITVTGVVGDGTTDTDITYVGTVPTGFVLEVVSSVANTAYTGSLLIVNKTPFPQILNIQATIDSTKFFKLSTIRGQKYVQNIVIIDGVITNLLNQISPEMMWPQLEPGLNEFGVVADESGQTWTLKYYPRFGGL
jgi:hypothetical protein